jgi:hypothetical protein
MKTSLFEKLLFGTPEWIITTLVYGVGGGILFLLLFSGCAPLEPLPGLCYTDKTGTYVCMDSKEHKEYIEKKKYTAKQICLPYAGTDWWFECMQNET